MDPKMAVFLFVGFMLLGVIIAISFTNISSFLMIGPDVDEVLLTNLISDCQSQLRVYEQINTEITRKVFCCTGMDLNQDGVIGEGETCAKICPDCNNIQICSEPIDYYTTIELCDI